MNCSDENIIALIQEPGQRFEYQAVKCLMKCKVQINAVLLKMHLREEDERNSFFHHAMAEFFIQVRQGKFILTGEAKICTYLTEIAKRKWLGFSKRNKREEGALPEKESGSREEPGEQVQAALKKLSASDRDILVAFYFYGRSLDDYARQKKISYGSAKKRISRARERLKIILKPAE